MKQNVLKMPKQTGIYAPHSKLVIIRKSTKNTPHHNILGMAHQNQREFETAVTP